MMSVNEAIEKLSVYFSGEKYQVEVVEAKRVFFADVGIDDKESERYERWMNIFYDWYLFSRPLVGTNLPPARFALEIEEFQSLSGDDKQVFVQLANSEAALLQFIKVKDESIYFTDLLRRRKVRVRNQDFVLSLEKGDICEVRLIPNGEEFLFSKGFCQHPREANKFILKEVKGLKKATEQEHQEFQIGLIRMYFKMEQYSHLKVDQIYTLDSKVRF